MSAAVRLRSPQVERPGNAGRKSGIQTLQIASSGGRKPTAEGGTLAALLRGIHDLHGPPPPAGQAGLRGRVGRAGRWQAPAPLAAGGVFHRPFGSAGSWEVGGFGTLSLPLVLS